MKVSVIIPVFNSDKHIDRCVRSVISQSYDNIEIVVVNDGSTDGTSNKLNSLAKADERLQIVNQKNSGTHMARMNGLKNSTGDVILNLDSDDYLESNAVALLVEKMQETEADIVVAHYYQHRNGIKRLMKNTIPTKGDQIEAIKYMLLGKTSVYLWGRLFKRHLMESVRLPVKRAYSEDVLTNFFILCNNEVKLALVEASVLNYVIHTTNISYSKKRKPVEGFFNEFEIAEKMLKSKGLDILLKDEIALHKSLMWISYCRKGGLKSKIPEYQKRFYKENYPLAKRFLPIHFKIEMFVYSKSHRLGNWFTKLLFWTYEHLAIRGLLKTS